MPGTLLSTLKEKKLIYFWPHWVSNAARKLPPLAVLKLLIIVRGLERVRASAVVVHARSLQHSGGVAPRYVEPFWTTEGICVLPGGTSGKRTCLPMQET